MKGRPKINAYPEAQPRQDFWASRRRQERLHKALALAAMCAIAVVMIIPLAWMIAVSLKEPQNVFKNPPFHVDWRWHNYVEAWYPQGLPTLTGGWFSKVVDFFCAKESFWLYLWNTVVITVLATLGAVFVSAFVAYGFARMRFTGKGPLFVLVLATMMIPAQVTMIPTFILYAHLGWVGTYLPLIVPAWLGSSGFNIFLLRQFFMGIPVDLDEAAKIDGCSSFGIFWRILLPLSVPVLITVGIFSVVYNWSDFMNPLIYIKDTRDFTLALGLNQFSSLYGNKTHLMMAASTVVLMPILVLFFVGQKYFIQGIVTTGLKG